MATRKHIPFVKMQAAGNDFILLDALHSGPLPWPELARWMAARHFGVGADGLLTLMPSQVAEFRMRMFNPDGSEDMSGNGLRCLVKYLHDRGLAAQEEVPLETIAGVRKTWLLEQEGKQSIIRAEMGVPSLRPADLPMGVEAETALRYPLEVGGLVWKVNCVSVGTPHAVIFASEEVIRDAFDRVSPEIETHPLFPERISVDWCHPEGKGLLRVRVWERAVGETLACGTGACAAAVAGGLLGHCGGEVDVRLPGGTLKVSWQPGEVVFLTGPAEEVFRGVWRGARPRQPVAGRARMRA